MPAEIIIVDMRRKNLQGCVVNTTSKAEGNWERDLSPFHLGPCQLYEFDEQMLIARRMENAWQFAKVYKQYADEDGNPTEEYWKWAMDGWMNPKPIRFPIRRGAKPEYSLWKGQKLGYIDARKQIYIPLYAEAVQKTDGWKYLQELYETEEILTLRDYDGYDHIGMEMSLTDVMNNPKRPMGHAFVLAMLLTQDEALKEADLREWRDV